MTMTLEEFASAVRVLTADDGEAARARYAAVFVRPGGAFDHLWTGLRGRQRVSLARWWGTVAATEVVWVMWDRPGGSGVAHPCDRVFGVDAVVECRVDDLERGVDWLPDDFYVFDESFSWSAVFTHESDVDGVVLYLVGAALPAEV